MNSKEISRLSTICICISFLFFLFRCTSSQPLSTSLLKSINNNNNNNDNMFADFSRMRPLPYSNSDESKFEENDSEVWTQLLNKLLEIYNEHDQNSRPSTSSPVRRANFWKRSNFWRKRANFW
ncbi:unnamed protein product [Rotaria sp. Silwood1]|nr:unnamed protein product [Rotaria sp. Silwood1]CAF3324683.1 unnamed protein product [Rotaria sp. Silwood1]